MVIVDLEISAKRLHVDENCDDIICEIAICMKRHPRKCFFFEVYRMCKFGKYCRYEHGNIVKDREVEAIVNREIVKSKIKFDSIEEEINNIKAEIDKLSKENEMLRRNIDNLKKSSSSENDQVGEVNETIYDDSKKDFKCDICDFKARSKSGLKIHSNSKHNKITPIDGFIENESESECDTSKLHNSFIDSDERENEDGPVEFADETTKEEINKFKCEWCGYNAETDDRLKKNMNYRQHGYWKCGECNFKMNSKEYFCDSCFSKGKIVPDNDM